MIPHSGQRQRVQGLQGQRGQAPGQHAGEVRMHPPGGAGRAKQPRVAVRAVVVEGAGIGTREGAEYPAADRFAGRTGQQIERQRHARSLSSGQFLFAPGASCVINGPCTPPPPACISGFTAIRSQRRRRARDPHELIDTITPNRQHPWRFFFGRHPGTTRRAAPMHHTDDLRICALTPLSTPAEVMRDCAATDAAMATVDASRRALHAIIPGSADRLAVVIGPCSIHDPRAALEYAGRLAPLRRDLADALEIVMRVYFEKPRTTVGWKGLINDPDLDGSFRIDKGLRLARGLLRDINTLGVPAGTEFLDMITPQYMADLVTWGAIGARTTESQIHRELVSGLSCPVGFKNGTSGNVQIAIEAVQSAAHPHTFLGHSKHGQSAIFVTKGNPDCHVILRGGRKTVNYDAASVSEACALLEKGGLKPQVMIDCSHANSNKDHTRQPLVS